MAAPGLSAPGQLEESKPMSPFTPTPGTVYFVGAGPGAPDLISVRGAQIIAQADLILYADSLVEESVARLARKPQARILGSSSLHLGELIPLMVETARAGGLVARVHSGDPGLYGAIHEQMAALDDHQVPYQIVPGITAAFAAGARLGIGLTVPDVVQTVILTRTAGRTTMPAGEDLRTLAASGASLAIYLSVSRIRRVVDDLLASRGYGPETPVAVLHKVTWPDESHVLGTLADIVEKVRAAGYTKHALVLVSPALDPALKGAERRTSSHLYDPSYTHRFRRAADASRRKERQEATGQVAGVQPGERHLAGKIAQAGARQGIVVIGLTRRGSRTAARLAQELGATLRLPRKQAQQAALAPLPDPTAALFDGSVLGEIRRQWSRRRQLVLVMPTGVAVRALAPLLGDKATDPGVVCLDEAGHSVIPLLGGHRAGANRLARRIAAITGGHAAITTASDIQGKPALDTLGQEEGWRLDPASAVTVASAALVDGEPLGLFVDPELPQDVQEQVQGWLSSVENLVPVASLDELEVDAFPAGLLVSHRLLSPRHQHLLGKCILYRPPVLVAGMGCRRGVPTAELRAGLEQAFLEGELALESLAALATAAIKAEEPGLQELARELGVPLRVVPQEALAQLTGEGFSPSAAQDRFGIPGVAEPCALLVSQGELILPKRVFPRCTVAVGRLG